MSERKLNASSLVQTLSFKKRPVTEKSVIKMLQTDSTQLDFIEKKIGDKGFSIVGKRNFY